MRLCSTEYCDPVLPVWTKCWYCSGFWRFWCSLITCSSCLVLWTTYPVSLWLFGTLLSWKLIGIGCNGLNRLSPWDAVEFVGFCGGACSWSDCEGDECCESERECSSCSDSTSLVFGLALLFLFEFDGSKSNEKMKLYHIWNIQLYGNEFWFQTNLNWTEKSTLLLVLLHELPVLILHYPPNTLFSASE